MPLYTDQTGTTFTFSNAPLRIVSLVPSQTELLHYLGLEEEVVGITKFCVYPNNWLKNKYRIGGTKTVVVDKVKALKPTLVLANKEENIRDQVEAIRRFAPVYTSDINDLQQALQMIHDVGNIIGKSESAVHLISRINQVFDDIAAYASRPLNVAYLIWKKPYMAAAGGTFIHDMLTRCGYKNVLENENRYPEITVEQLASRACDVILLSSEPYPFKQKDIDELKVVMPNVHFMLVNGEMFSWYGSRLFMAAEYFKLLRVQTDALEVR